MKQAEAGTLKGMLPTEAEAALKDVEGVLQLLSQYHHLTEDQRLTLHSRAGLARQKIGEVIKLLKKLDRLGLIAAKEPD